MSDLYEQYGLELEEDTSVANYPSPDKKEPTIKKSGGWLRSILALGLGIVIGVGAIAGGGYFALSTPARTAIETIGGFAGINYEEQVKNKFLSEEYEEKTLLEIGKELAKVVKDKSLAGVNNIVPVVGEYLDKLVNNMQTEFGVEMSTEALLSTPFHELPAYLGETFRVTPLGTMIKATSKAGTLEPILMEICYGEEGIHYHYDEEGNIVMNEGHEAATFETLGATPNAMLNKISLAAVLPPSDNDPLMLSMAYGKEYVTYVLERDENGNAVLDSKGKPIVTMLPLFYEKEGDTFYDYNNDPINCTFTEVENGFIRMEKQASYEGEATQTYFLKQAEDGKYYAYAEPVDTAEQVKFRKTMIGDLSANSSAMINNIYLKDALNIAYDPANPDNDPHPILFSLAYGTEGVDYRVDPTTKDIIMLGNATPRTIGDLRERGTGLINDIAISDIMSASTDDALSMYLLYGREGIHYAIEDDKVVMLQQFIAISEDSSKVYNEYGELLQMQTNDLQGYVLDPENSIFTDIHGVTYNYQAADPVKTIKTNDGQMQVYYLSKDGQPAMFTKHSLGELAGGNNLISCLTDRLSLSEVLHADNLNENKFLKHVSDCPVNEIPTKLMEISITDMFSDEVYGLGTLKYEGETPLTAVNGELIENGDYYTQDADGYHKATLKSTWKYLLTDPNGVKAPSDYKAATDMDELISNMTANVQTAKMRDLKNDGIIAGLSESMLTTKVIEGYGEITFPLPPHAVPNVTEMGELTVTELLEYTTAMSQVIANLPGSP